MIKSTETSIATENELRTQADYLEEKYTNGGLTYEKFFNCSNNEYENEILLLAYYFGK